MSKPTPLASYCPVCGAKTQIDRQANVFCTSRVCEHFGKAIVLKLEANGSKTAQIPTEGNSAYAVATRQVDYLLDTLVPCSPTDHYGDLARASKRKLDCLAEAITDLAAIERSIRSLPLPTADREKMQTKLNQIAAWIQIEAEHATKINESSSAVVLARFKTAEATDNVTTTTQKTIDALKALIASEKALLDNLGR